MHHDRSHKRSEHELKRLVEQAIADTFDLQLRGLALHVDAVEVRGSPPRELTAWATMHFLAAGSPFCCGEPGCQLDLHGASGERVADHVRRAMGLRQHVTLVFGDRVGVRYHDGVRFEVGEP